MESLPRQLSWLGRSLAGPGLPGLQSSDSSCASELARRAVGRLNEVTVFRLRSPKLCPQ